MTCNLKLLVKMWGGSSCPSRPPSDGPVNMDIYALAEEAAES